MTITQEDKLLIELAAKAMGIDGYWHEEHFEDGQAVCGILPKGFEGIAILHLFNPLTSDSDAHLLMCELEIDLYWITNEVEAIKVDDKKGRIYRKQEHHVNTLESKRLAVNRAITRVAAAIQQEKEK